MLQLMCFTTFACPVRGPDSCSESSPPSSASIPCEPDLARFLPCCLPLPLLAAVLAAVLALATAAASRREALPIVVARRGLRGPQRPTWLREDASGAAETANTPDSSERLEVWRPGEFRNPGPPVCDL